MMADRAGASDRDPERPAGSPAERRRARRATMANAVSSPEEPELPTPRTLARVSQRVAAIAESATLAVDAKAKALKAAGEPVIGFGAGEPDFPTPAHIVEAAVEAARDPKNHKYTPAGGLPELKEAIAAKTLRDSGPRRAAPSQVLVTNGGKHAVYNTFATLLDPGDEVLLPAPYWTTYPEPIALVRRRAGGAAHRRDHRLPGHGRPARRGRHRSHQGAAVRVARQPHRRGVPGGGGRGDRPLGGRARHLGDHRRDLRAPHLRRPPVQLDARARCPSCRSSASCSTAWPRPTP